MAALVATCASASLPTAQDFDATPFIGAYDDNEGGNMTFTLTDVTYKSASYDLKQDNTKAVLVRYGTTRGYQFRTCEPDNIAVYYK